MLQLLVEVLIFRETDLSEWVCVRVYVLPHKPVFVCVYVRVCTCVPACAYECVYVCFGLPCARVLALYARAFIIYEIIFN